MKIRDDELMKQVSSRLKELTGGKDLAALGREIGMSGNIVWRYVNGLTLPSTSALFKLADALGVTADYLLTGKQNQVAESQATYFSGTLTEEIVDTLDKLFEKEGLSLPPKKLWQLIVYLREELAEDKDRDSRKAKIIRVMKLAS